MMMTLTTSFEHSVSGTALPVDYQPSPHTVIIGRGNEPKQNMGNKRLVVLAQSFLKKYQNGDKKCKTEIVKDIIGMIYEACKGGKGSFVKRDKKSGGQWYEVDYSAAREKVGYVFRDLLADQYKSSSKSKVARRQRPTMFLQRQDSSSSMQSNSTTRSMAVVSDDESVSTTAPSSPPLDVSDILVQSAAFLEERFIKSASFEEPEFTQTIPTTSPATSTCSFSFHDVDDEVHFDFESLLRLPLM